MKSSLGQGRVKDLSRGQGSARMKVTQKPGQGRLISFHLSLLPPDLIFEVTFEAIVQMCAEE